MVPKPMTADASPNESLRSRPALTAPPAAAVAGVVFALLMIVGLVLVRYAIPEDPTKPGTWLTEPERRDALRFALDLVPFAGIAFLWFIGVLRDRLGEREDQFFATAFLASGLLFVASLFAAAAITDAQIATIAGGHIDEKLYTFSRRLSDTLLNLFAMKMAGVFIFSTCTIGLRTGIFPRRIAHVGYVCGLLLLLIIAKWRWITLIFPLWMLLVSGAILLGDFRTRIARRNRRPRLRPQS
jgi:hypothetical protein